jgi:hypothetical protein
LKLCSNSMVLTRHVIPLKSTDKTSAEESIMGSKLPEVQISHKETDSSG